MTYKTTQKLEFYGKVDFIPEGRTSYTVANGKAYFKTDKGVRIGFTIDEMHDFYFKKV
jgi:hypothetical protein